MKEMPWFTRPWTKIKRNGSKGLDDAELLSIIFMRGNEKESALELANKLLVNYNLNYFSSCSLKELTTLLGEETKAMQIMALAELNSRYTKLKDKAFTKTTVETAEDVYNKFKEEVKDKRKEHLYVVLLDAKNKIIKTPLISVGSLNQSFAHPREVFYPAIKESANALILVHNHPSGDPKPSPDDIRITKKLIRAGQILGIKVLDHIIVGNGKYWSWVEERK